MDVLRLKDLDIYQVAVAIGEDVWRFVLKWDSFAKGTVGKQFVEVADSVSANIAEGYGLFFLQRQENVLRL